MADIEPSNSPDQANDLGIIGPQHYKFPEGYERSHNLLSFGEFEKDRGENSFPTDYYKFAVPEGVTAVVATAALWRPTTEVEA